MTTAHARLPPSAAARWVECPGSVQLCENEALPERDDGGEGEEGTAWHWLISETLRGRTPLPSATAPNGILLTPEMHEAAGVVFKAIREPLASLVVEQRVDATSIHKDVWGTCDLHWIDRAARRITVVDFKYGFGLVEPFRHPQPAIYAIGILDGMGEAADEAWQVDLTIIQPRPWHRHGPVRTWHTTSAELREAARHYRQAAEEATGNNPSTSAGHQCKHCPARHACPALRNVVLESLDYLYSTEPAILPPDALAHELRVLKRAGKLLEARWSGLEALAASLIGMEQKIPGWTVETQPGREEWTKPAAEITALGDIYGVKLSKGPALLTPAQARKLGVDVSAYSARKPGTAKLVEEDMTAVAAVFSGGSHGAPQ